MFSEFGWILKFTRLEIKEIILLAFNLNFVDFFEDYKLRPDSYVIQF